MQIGADGRLGAAVDTRESALADGAQFGRSRNRFVRTAKRRSRRRAIIFDPRPDGENEHDAPGRAARAMDHVISNSIQRAVRIRIKRVDMTIRDHGTRKTGSDARAQILPTLPLRPTKWARPARTSRASLCRLLDGSNRGHNSISLSYRRRRAHDVVGHDRAKSRSRNFTIDPTGTLMLGNRAPTSDLQNIRTKARSSPSARPKSRGQHSSGRCVLEGNKAQDSLLVMRRRAVSEQEAKRCCSIRSLTSRYKRR